MRRNSQLLRGVAVWTIILSGCSLTKPRQEVYHYTLALHLPETAMSTVKATLIVRNFLAQDPYNQERLVYRTSPYQLDFYNYHRWAAIPTEQVTDWTRRYLRTTSLFAKVYPTSDGAADFILTGKIRQLDEIDHEQAWEATLSIDFWLTRAEQRTPLWFQSYSATQQTAKRNPSAVAEAMSRNLETILSKLVTDLAPVVAAPTGP
jgi:ABC-type uncharacterized transport system auxiliary subunit